MLVGQYFGWQKRFTLSESICREKSDLATILQTYFDFEFHFVDLLLERLHLVLRLVPVAEKPREVIDLGLVLELLLLRAPNSAVQARVQVRVLIRKLLEFLLVDALNPCKLISQLSVS